MITKEKKQYEFRVVPNTGDFGMGGRKMSEKGREERSL